MTLLLISFGDTVDLDFQTVFCILAFLFMIGSLCGWVLELLFRRIFTAKKWINPGFLTGPYLPIYGFGISILFAVCSLDYKAIFHFDFWNSQAAYDIFVILLIGIAMTLIELVAGLIFIRGMKIRLWDYSDRWGNWKGIICPLFSLLWTLAGALFYFFLNPLLMKSVYWLLSNYYFIFFVGIFFGIMIVDFCASVRLTARIKALAEEKQIVVKFEKLKESIRSELEAKKEKAKFLFAFRSSHKLEEHMETYINEERAPKLPRSRKSAAKKKDKNEKGSEQE